MSKAKVMPKGQHDSRRGPKPKGTVSRNIDNIDQVYVRSGLVLTAPQTTEEEKAVAWWKGLKPNGRLAVLVQMWRRGNEEL